MTSKEIITRIINRDNPPRIGFHFNHPHPSDIHMVAGAAYLPSDIPPQHQKWGVHPELLEQVPWFRGEVMMDNYGNIYGRLNGITKGECIKGALHDWSLLDHFKFPDIDLTYYKTLKQSLTGSDQFVVAALPLNVFSTLRDIRLMDNALMDTVLEPDRVRQFLKMVAEIDCQICGNLKDVGADAVMFFDDWGTQDRTFIGLDGFKELFQPVYARICATAHDAGLKVFMHSCGKNNLLVEPLVEAGIDVFQYDQPDVYPAQWLADHFGHKATFYMPVDIQRVMPTGDRRLIERSARELIETFRRRGASIIVKDYPSWEDINVKEEWADWARNIFIDYAKNETAVPYR